MNFSLFLNQVQILMHTQGIKLKENAEENRVSYSWLRKNKKQNLVWISLRQELLIRKALSEISQEEQTKAIKELVNYTETNLNLDPSKIPDVCLEILYKVNTFETVRRESLKRANVFRRSLMRLSVGSNRVSPALLFLPSNRNTHRKSVKFCNNPQIFSISD